MNFDDARNFHERTAEAKFPGYKGPVWGQITPTPKYLELPRRTQVGFDDGTAYWLDVPAKSLIGGDMVQIVERSGKYKVGNRKGFHRVSFVGMTMNPEFFDQTDVVPYKFGTFVELIREVE